MRKDIYLKDPNRVTEHVNPRKRIPFPKNKGPYINATIELLHSIKSYQSASGNLSLKEGAMFEIDELTDDVESVQYPSTGVIVEAYAYLATGRFFSTSRTPSEYGDADVNDGELVIIYTNNLTENEIATIRANNLCRITIQLYTSKAVLFKYVTGNTYSDHLELKVVPAK